jgi:hypothetical protein
MPDASGNNINKNTSEKQFGDLVGSVFNKSSIIFIITFLGIYFLAYFVLGFFFNKGEDSSSFELKLSRTVDILFLVILLFIFGTFMFSKSDDQKISTFSSLYNSTTKYVDEPYAAFTTAIILALFYFIVYLFRIPMTKESKPIFIYVIESAIWIFLIIILFVAFFKYILDISLTDKLSTVDLPDKPSKVVVDTSLSSRLNVSQNEVFNVSNNLYTYEDAQAICTSYGANIATYDQIEDSYNRGAEWCNYGWSDGQMALFPTQKDTWNKLQKTKNNKNDCGRPGVNGGYIANPYVKFGVNCFGKKPKPTDDDLARLARLRQQPAPISEADADLNAKVQYWKENAYKLLTLNSYNKNVWSEY